MTKASGKNYDFLDVLVLKTKPGQTRRVKKLEGIWEGLGFEWIADLKQEIWASRRDAEQSLSKRLVKGST